MAHWTQQIAEAYRALQEAELLKGRVAAAKQVELAAQGNPNAVKAIMRVEKLGATNRKVLRHASTSLDSNTSPQYKVGKDTFDIDNIGFADAQIRPKSTRNQSDEDMLADASRGASGTLSERPNPHYKKVLNFNNLPHAIRQAKVNAQKGKPNITKTRFAFSPKKSTLRPLMSAPPKMDQDI